MTLRDLNKSAAWRFIILVGVVSLFSDMTYEGARSISGPFLGQLKASALVAFSVTPRLLAIPIFLAVSRQVCLLPQPPDGFG